MALELLDGTTAAFDFTSGLRTTYGGTPGTPISWKNVASYLSIDIGREMFDMTTFGNNGWRIRRGGMKSLVGRLAMFLSKGLAISDPIYLFANNFAWAMVATLETGCTISADAHQVTRHVGMQAAGVSEDGITFEAASAPTTAWVIV